MRRIGTVGSYVSISGYWYAVVVERTSAGAAWHTTIIDREVDAGAASLAVARRAGTGRRPHAPRERLRLHQTQRRAAPAGRRLDQVWKF